MSDWRGCDWRLRSTATAVLLLLVYPKFDLHFLAPIALTPLLVAVARVPNGWRRFLMGWLSGTALWFFLCTWIQFVLEDHANMGKFASWGSFVSVCGVEGFAHGGVRLVGGPVDEAELCGAGGGRVMGRT